MAPSVDLQWGTRSRQRVGGVDVHVEHAGDTGDLLIAAAHGFASGTFTWAGVAPGWSGHRPVVAWDRPPFGRSERPTPRVGDDDPYAVDREIDRSTAVIETHLAQHEASGVVLVGHSAGSLLSLQLVLARRLPVQAVVLIAPALASEPPAFIRKVAALPGANRIGSAALGLGIRGARPALRAMSAHPSPIIEATAAESSRCLRRPGTARALWHLTATWQPPDLMDDLVPLGVPTMVIGGRDDRISPPEPTTVVADRLGAQLHLLDDVGHAAHEQVPNLVGPLITRFLDELGG